MRATTLNLIRKSPEKETFKGSNIFKKEEPPEVFSKNMATYSIVGDFDFKSKFFEKHNEQKQKKQMPQLYKGQTQIKCSAPFRQNYTFISGKAASRINHFSLDQSQEENRMTRILQLQSLKRKQWQKQNKSLKKKMNKAITATFEHTPKTYYHQNPEKLQLINENIPEYWKNSLRSNEKRLKKYLKGNRLEDGKVNELLQTLDGSRKLERGIPKIDQKYKNIEIRLKARGATFCTNKSDRTFLEKTISTLNNTGDQIYKANYLNRHKWINQINLNKTFQKFTQTKDNF